MILGCKQAFLHASLSRDMASDATQRADHILLPHWAHA